jgi:D-xylose reductase
MPSVGLGLWKIPKTDCENAVFSAIKSGYRLLDGACDYGNEVEVGLGIKKALDEGVCKREDLFIVSKLWNTFHRPEHVEEGCRKSLKDLGVDYLDLYIIHFPIAMKYVPIDVKYPPEW